MTNDQTESLTVDLACDASLDGSVRGPSCSMESTRQRLEMNQADQQMRLRLSWAMVLEENMRGKENGRW